MNNLINISYLKYMNEGETVNIKGILIRSRIVWAKNGKSYALIKWITLVDEENNTIDCKLVNNQVNLKIFYHDFLILNI